MTRHPCFRAVDGAIIRASTYPSGLACPPFPDLDSGDALGIVTWICAVWDLPGLADAITVASPDLTSALTAICGHPTAPRPWRQVRRAAESLMCYLLRWQWRATPFGLFAGVAHVALGPTASARFGDQHTMVARPHSTWVASTVTTLEAQPGLLRQLPVVASNLGFARGDDWVLPCQPDGSDSPVSEVLVRATAAVRMALDAARTPVIFADLQARLAAESPQTPPDVIEGMLAELVHLKILLTSLWPPMTETNPFAHLAGQLARTAPTAVPCPETRQAPGVRLDCDIVLPPTVIREAEKAAAILTRLAPPRPAWAAYHTAFTDRYGPGAIVAVTELVDPDRGLGYPAGFRGTLLRSTTPATGRYTALAALAQMAALDGCAEVALDEDLLAGLETSREVHPVPHTELRFSVSAPTLAALDAGAFTLTVLSASRHAGTTVGRFLHVLAGPDRDRITRAYQNLPVGTAGAIAVQISSPSLTARTDMLARSPRVLPVLSLGEHRPAGEPGIDLADLAVTADADRLILVSRSQGRAIEPLIFNAVDLRHRAHPLARFLCEISTAAAASCTPLSWGPLAGQLPFLPRVRIGRAILSPARWNLASTDLPSPNTSPREWTRQFEQLRCARRIPDTVLVGDDDVLLRLDLATVSHLALLRRHLDRAGTASVLEDGSDLGWTGGRAHEIVMPLASTAAPRPLARAVRPSSTWQGPGHLPGASPWLQASLAGHPGRQNELLIKWLPSLLDQWTHGPVDGWWFVRCRTPSHHLRIRLPLDGSGTYGAAARDFSEWARRLHEAGLLADFTLGTYRPETGRYGARSAMAAAEATFAADSAFAVAQLRTAAHVEAATAAGMISLAAAFCGEATNPWLVGHLNHGGGPSLDRNLLAQAGQSPAISPELLHRRYSAAAAYRELLDDANADIVLADLLHLHHARMIGTDTDSERRCLRLARAAAQTARERNRPSTCANGPAPVPTT
jgi:thiopeptide-type bacteriocin biosynthesis protein